MPAGRRRCTRRKVSRSVHRPHATRNAPLNSIRTGQSNGKDGEAFVERVCDVLGDAGVPLQRFHECHDDPRNGWQLTCFRERQFRHQAFCISVHVSPVVVF